MLLTLARTVHIGGLDNNSIPWLKEVVTGIMQSTPLTLPSHTLKHFPQEFIFNQFILCPNISICNDHFYTFLVWLRNRSYIRWIRNRSQPYWKFTCSLVAQKFSTNIKIIIKLIPVLLARPFGQPRLTRLVLILLFQ